MGDGHSGFVPICNLRSVSVPPGQMQPLCPCSTTTCLLEDPPHPLSPPYPLLIPYSLFKNEVFILKKKEKILARRPRWLPPLFPIRRHIPGKGSLFSPLSLLNPLPGGLYPQGPAGSALATAVSPSGLARSAAWAALAGSGSRAPAASLTPSVASACAHGRAPLWVLRTRHEPSPQALPSSCFVRLSPPGLGCQRFPFPPPLSVRTLSGLSPDFSLYCTVPLGELPLPPPGHQGPTWQFVPLTALLRNRPSCPSASCTCPLCHQSSVPEQPMAPTCSPSRPQLPKRTPRSRCSVCLVLPRPQQRPRPLQ